MNRFFCFLCLAAFAAILGGTAGCSRQHYRMKADREVYSILREGNNDPRWRIDDYRITPDYTSRMFDPYHPDQEPMPQDDPTAHQKMHWVAGMKGSSDWYEHGSTQTVENPRWRQFLMLNENGEIPLDRDRALELARLHSHEYQTRLENLYSTAMSVAQQRFRYDTQFRGLGDLVYTNSSNKLSNSASIDARRRTAAGAQWVAELANTVTWTFTGQTSWQMDTLINASLTQPLLRGASRKYELESLTQYERDFLYAVREMVLFQQGHYTRIVTGSVPQNSGASGGTGIYGLLREQIQIQNRKQYIIGMEENLNRFLEMFDANQVTDVTQIAEMRQDLLSNQSTLLGQVNTYQSNIESYIRSLGLPPDLHVSIDDPLLEQFQLSSPELTVLMDDVAKLLAMIRKKDEPLAEDFREKTKDIVRRAGGEIIVLGQDLDILQKSIPERIRGLKDLEAVLSESIASGERIDPTIYDTGEFETRINELRMKDIPKNRDRLRAFFTILNMFVDTEESELREIIRNRLYDESVSEALDFLYLTNAAGMPNSNIFPKQRGPEEITEWMETLRASETKEETPIVKTPEQILKEQQRAEARKIIEELRRRDEYRDWIRQVFSDFQYELVSLSLMQTRARIESMTLVPVSVSADEAFQMASEHRLDWMNEKAKLVDAWRAIDVSADRLKGVLDLQLSGRTGRRDTNNGRTADLSEVQATLEWDTPLNRYSEMMTYRSRQVDYQRARRAYYMYVDSVNLELRNIVRNLQMRRIDFEINRNAVRIGTIRVDVMQLRMDQPPARGGRIDTNAALSLINALNGLLTSQNNLLNTWVQYETQRMLLDYGMGTMQLDDRGRWIEPDAMASADASLPALAPEVVPLKIPVPVLDTPKLNRRYVDLR